MVYRPIDDAHRGGQGGRRRRARTAFMAPNTHRSHSAANGMETPSVMFLARSPTRLPRDRRARGAATARPWRAGEQHEAQRVGDRGRTGRSTSKSRSTCMATQPPKNQLSRMALHRVQCRAAASSTGKTRRRSCCAARRRNRAITPPEQGDGDDEDGAQDRLEQRRPLNSAAGRPGCRARSWQPQHVVGEAQAENRRALLDGVERHRQHVLSPAAACRPGRLLESRSRAPSRPAVSSRIRQGPCLADLGGDVPAPDPRELAGDQAAVRCEWPSHGT